ncbi:unnamed protein product [Microthlaspi erraticum]|uniref:Uncharacterized protein n=1 Tax=Microthlaspi erraticum TaxID=1685480 RepID=A0A6D2KTL1_9BRAS|nr:unnamed protein product [Microthlaspi erraticum]
MMNPPPFQIVNHAPLLGQSHAMMKNQPPMMNVPNFSPNPNLINPTNYSHNWEGKKMDPVRRMRNSGDNRVNKPRALNEFQSQNRKFYAKKKYANRYVPYAPRNTTSFIIRAKKSGGITDLVSPCPVTPSVLPTPTFSPSREVLGDMAKEDGELMGMDQ